MPLKYFQIDAFAGEIFRGNPAGVVPLDSWPSDDVLQSMASEHNLSETAFFVPEEGGAADFRLRWMTPRSEVDLCGHATLAAAHVLFRHLGWSGTDVRFSSRSGLLTVRRDGEKYELDFPALPLEPSEVSDAIVNSLGTRPREVFAGMDLVCVFANEDEVRALRPDFAALGLIDGVRAVAATARGTDYDFVSRLFAPAVGIDEDPVTGSLHCMLAPLWSERLGRDRLRAWQASDRGGEIVCTVVDGRVLLSGGAATYLEGTITVDLG
ncbi:MAG: PhzF family phenazine biosynthesis protein [Planctomycetota bacterium]